MSLTSQIFELSNKQVKELYNVMLDASLAHETGGDAREIFRRAKQRKVGRQRRIIELLENATKPEIDRLSANLAEHGR